MSLALALGLDRTAHVLANGDFIDRVFWSNRLTRAAEILQAARKAPAPK